jgi:two-component system OmpR family sensor kinase
MHRPRTLRSRLFTWFLGAILLAILTSTLVVATTRPEPSTGIEAMARNVSGRLAAAWDDPESIRAYVDEVRDVTGFDVRVVRQPNGLPPRVRRIAEHGGRLAPDGPQHVFVPVVRGGEVIGALEMDRLGARPVPWAWWRFALALALVAAVLSVMAGRVANLIAHPLEQLARAADRFGGGDLAFRADLAGASGGGLRAAARQWVALEVRDVAVAFNRMADRVEATVRGQRELLGAISHELRSPLGRARVALEILRDRLAGTASASDRTLHGTLDDIEKQLAAIDAILGDLLDVTRAGLADLRKETRLFADWLRARIADEPTPPAIDLEVTPEARDSAIAFDSALLARAVHNLFLNARAHGHSPDLPLEARVSRRGERLCFAVRDQGPGFAPGLSEKAFEPFVRGDPSRARPATGAGHGLGLAIVRRVVEAHGGRVFAHNDPIRGAIVGFDLPALPPHG